VNRSSLGRVLLVGVLVLPLVGGCSDDKKKQTTDNDPDDRPTVVVTAQPQDPQSARLAVEQEFGLLVGGDWAGVWETWTTEAQGALSKDSYVNLLSTCPSQGQSYQVVDVKPVDASTVTVDWQRQNAAGAQENGSTTVKYEAGNWRIDPGSAALTAYKNGTCA